MDQYYCVSSSDLSEMADIALSNCDLKNLHEIRSVQQLREKERFSQLQGMRSENLLNSKDSV